MRRAVRVALIALFSLVFVATPFAFASEDEEDPRCKIAQILDLTEEQEEKLEKLQEKKFETLEKSKAKLDIEKAKLRLLWMEDKPKKKELLAQHDEMAKIRRLMTEAKIDYRLGMSKLLSDEQQREAKRLMKRSRRGRKGRRSRRRRFGRGGFRRQGGGFGRHGGGFGRHGGGFGRHGGGFGGHRKRSMGRDAYGRWRQSEDQGYDGDYDGDEGKPEDEAKQ